MFDVYTKTYEGAFEVDGVKYDPNANPPDESGPMVVKGGWVSGFGDERRAWERIEAGQRERKWREENPHADANEMFERYEEKFRKWNMEEENDPEAIERRAQAAEEKRKEQGLEMKQAQTWAWPAPQLPARGETPQDSSTSFRNVGLGLQLASERCAHRLSVSVLAYPMPVQVYARMCMQIVVFLCQD